MVAAGKDVESVAKKFVGERGSDPEASCGIFGVGDRKVDFFGRDDAFQMTGDEVPAGGREDVADKE